MGIVDREYFKALTGRTFDTDLAAIRYYSEHEDDAALGLSLNPLIEKDWLSQQVAGSDASWYATLLTHPKRFSTSPYFDAEKYAGDAPLARQKRRPTLQALRHFLRTATPTTLMPTHESRGGALLTWGECRAQALADARRFAEQLHLRRQRTTEAWDSAKEQGFLQSIKNQGSADSAAQPPLVSIVMPTRDRLASLRIAIDSVRSQTHTNWHLIVIDDGSTDGTPDYLREIGMEDPRISVVLQAAAGVSAARNRGLTEAAGDYIAFLDSDNTWRPHFLEYSLAGIAARGVDAVHCGVVLHRDDGITRYRGIEGTRDDLLHAGNFLDLNSVVIAKPAVDAVGGFDETIKRWVDYDLFLAMSATLVPAYLPFLGVDYDDRTSEGRITGGELASWEDVVVGKHLIDWEALENGVAERDPGTVSIIIPTYTDWRLTATAVRAVLESSGERPLDVIVIDNASRRHVYAILRALFSGQPSVRVMRMARNLNFALANNYGLSISRGEYVVALNNDTEVKLGWLEPLLAPLEQSGSVLGTQPLLVYGDGSVQTAGTVFLEDGTLPRHFLVGHSADEARALESQDYSAVTAAALCMRARDLISLHGFDPLYTNGMEDVDLCLRARRLHDGAFRVVPDSVVVHHESKTPGRARAVSRNRALFLERWAGDFPPSDRWRFDALGLEPETN